MPIADQPVIDQIWLVGHCVSLLPFVVELLEGETLSALLTRAQREQFAAQDHTVFTLVSLLEVLRPAVPTLGVHRFPLV